MTRRDARTRAGALLLLVGVLVAGCGGGDAKRAGQGPDPFVAVESRAKNDEQRALTRAAPRWAPVKVIRGQGPGVNPVEIASDAVQWRVRWRCAEGSFTVTAQGKPLGRGACPKPGTADGTGRGRITLRVAAPGAWEMTVEQQVTTPLVEPPLPALSAAGTRVVARGRFKELERRGKGRVTLYRLASGRSVLRIEGFSTTANTDLAVWLSPARAPQTTRAILAAGHVKIANLKATVGDQNYLVPRGVKLGNARSVVIWCEPIRIAYTAAALSR